MVGYKMGSSLAKVFITAETPPEENFRISSMDERMTWMSIWQRFIRGGFYGGRVS